MQGFGLRAHPGSLPHMEPYQLDQSLVLSIPHLHHPVHKNQRNLHNYRPPAPSSPLRPSSLLPSQGLQNPRGHPWSCLLGGSHLLLPSLQIPSLARGWDLGIPQTIQQKLRSQSRAPWYLGIWSR